MTQPPVTKESQALVSSLADRRYHVLGILEGLSEEDLRRPVLPSHWTCAGLVHHLAIDVERFWFRAVVAGEPMPDEEPDNAWHVPTRLVGAAGRKDRSRASCLAQRSATANSVSGPAPWLAGLKTKTMRTPPDGWR
jgi:Protein of unknown function (DUF664)